MKAVYYTTRNFIRHEGNVIDLMEYRRRMAQVQGSLALAPQPEEAPRYETARPRTHARARRRGLADWLDIAASMATIAVVLGAWLQLMI